MILFQSTAYQHMRASLLALYFLSLCYLTLVHFFMFSFLPCPSPSFIFTCNSFLLSCIALDVVFHTFYPIPSLFTPPLFFRRTRIHSSIFSFLRPSTIRYSLQKWSTLSFFSPFLLLLLRMFLLLLAFSYSPFFRARLPGRPPSLSFTILAIGEEPLVGSRGCSRQ